jgi:hypothetical protein
MKYMDIDCYERGCACTSSNRVAGEDCEVVDVVKFRELSDEEIGEIFSKYGEKDKWFDFARAILKKASEG